jgi:hypothetical protein
MVYTDLHYFGSVSYYKEIVATDQLVFDTITSFSKMSFKNRMIITTAQGPLHLSIPIVGGRDQKTPMNEIKIANDSPWKAQHYKSICTNYKRAPFFDYYEASLYDLYSKDYNMLNDFLLATQQWIQQQLKGKWIILANLDASTLTENVKWIDPFKPNNFQTSDDFVTYQQVFDANTGFIPNVCILDLIFAVGGRQALSMLISK